MNNTELNTIFKELLTVYSNLKAEVIATQVNNNLEDKVEFLIENKSSFSRPYRRDVIKINKTEEDNQLLLELSRNGIYDSLPEALFHNETTANNRKISYSKKRQTYKEEEQSARSFFSPIENEFFNQRLNIEENEKNILKDFYNLEDDFLINFWNVDKNIPKHFQLKLIKLLPYSFAIAGDLELTRLSLEKVLNQNVTFKTKYKNNINVSANKDKALGVNLVTESKTTNVAQPYIKATIGPIKESDLDTFANNEGLQLFLKAFYSYFMPLELDVETTITTNKTEGFILNGSIDAMIGLTTTL